MIEFPFGNRSGQVPRYVAGAGEEMVIPMADSISFQQRAFRGDDPFVWVHPAVNQERICAPEQRRIQFEFASEFLLDIELEHVRKF